MKTRLIKMLTYLICKLSNKNKHYWDMDRVCSNHGYSVNDYKPIDFDMTMSCPPGFEFNKAYTFEDFYCRSLLFLILNMDPYYLLKSCNIKFIRLPLGVF